MRVGGRRLVIVLLVLMMLGGGTALWLRYAGGMQRLQLMTTGMDDWVGRQIVAIANAYMVPQIAFERLEYQAPATVVLTNVTFTAPDGTRVFDVGSMTVRLAETPSIGRPISIASLVIENGQVNLIQNEDGDGFRGLQPLVKRRYERERAAESSSANLSDVLELREVRIINGGLRLDLGRGDPMVLRDLELALDIRPLAEAASEGDEGRPSGPGWYAMVLNTGRPPNAVIRADARLNIDTFEVDLASSEVALDVTAQSIEALPPQLQTLLRQYQARGSLRVQASGRVPLRDLNAGKAKAAVTLSGFNLTQGELRLPIDRLSAEGELDGGVLRIGGGIIRMLGGSVAFRGQLPIGEGAAPGELDWSANRLELEQLLAAYSAPSTPTENQPAPSENTSTSNGAGNSAGSASAPATRSRLAGRLSGEGVIRLNAQDIPASLGGDGAVEVNDGRLLMIPGLTQLAQLMRVGERLMGDTTRTHRASARFQLTPEGIRVTESAVITTALAARATGIVAYDGTLDMSANAGPLERVQASMGPIGDIFGNITDRLVTYRIRGPMNSPSVSVAAGRGDQHRSERERQRAGSGTTPEPAPEPAPEPEPEPDPAPGGAR